MLILYLQNAKKYYAYLVSRFRSQWLTVPIGIRRAYPAESIRPVQINSDVTMRKLKE